MSYKVSEIQIIYKPKRGKRPQITCSRDAYVVFTEVFDWDTMEAFESFWMLLLNRANRVIGAYKVSNGSVAGTVVDAKLIFSVAVKALACSIVLAHNHPSGSLNPSQADIDLTRKLFNAGKLLDIIVVDHLIIVATGGFYSMADEGLMPN